MRTCDKISFCIKEKFYLQEKMARILIKDVSKRYGEVLAVKDMNLDVKDKEFIVLVGPSGCGKSTTLRMIAGLEVITTGEIYIGDRLINEVPPKDRKVAMVFQEYALYPHMTAYDNIAFGLKVRHESRKEIDKRVRRAAQMLELTELLDRKPGLLSGGERQRVALSRAIVRNPDVFLFDEPLSNLDAKLRTQARNDLIKLHRRLGVTSVYVTHDQTEAMTMGDRVAVLSHGVIQQIGAPGELYDHPQNKHVAGFIGSPAMNFIESKLVKKDGKIWIDGKGFMIKVPDNYIPLIEGYINKEVIFGIRPENVSLGRASFPSNEENTISAVVEMIEPLGTETVVHLTTPNPGNHTFISLSGREAIRLRRGEKVKVIFNLNKMHAFEKDTEKAIM